MSCARFLDDGLAANDVAGIAFTGEGRGQTFTQDRRLLDAAIGRLMGDVDPTDNQSHRLATSSLTRPRRWARFATGGRRSSWLRHRLFAQSTTANVARVSSTRCGHASNRMSACMPSIHEDSTRMNGPEPNTRIPIQGTGWRLRGGAERRSRARGVWRISRRVSWAAQRRAIPGGGERRLCRREQQQPRSGI